MPASVITSVSPPRCAPPLSTAPARLAAVMNTVSSPPKPKTVWPGPPSVTLSAPVEPSTRMPGVAPSRSSPRFGRLTLSKFVRPRRSQKPPVASSISSAPAPPSTTRPEASRERSLSVSAPAPSAPVAVALLVS